MAITLGDAIVFIKGNTGHLDKSLDSSEGKTRSAASRMGGFIKTGITTAAIGAAAAVVSIGAAAFSSASQINKSQNDLQAQLGLTEARAAELGKVALNVFKNNFGESIEDATAAVIEARQQLGDLADNELQAATKNAFRLADAYGVDVGDSLSAVRTLTEEFGMSQQAAFDFLTVGMRKGLNASGDFLDSVGEYANQFAGAGFEADEFFSAMETGLKGGMLGTDKMADAFKEAQVKLLELSDDMLENLEYAGVDVNRIFQGLHDGSITSADALKEIIPAINAIEDPVHRNSLGVQVFGTMWEDLGSSAFEALDLTTTKMEDMRGATLKLDKQYENLGAVVEGFKRRAMVAIAPIGDKLLGLANQVMPHVEVAFSWMEEKLPAIIDQVFLVLSQLTGFIQENVLPVLLEWGNWFINEGLPAIVAFLGPILEQLIPGLVQLATWVGDIAGFLLPILADVIGFVVDNFNIFGPVLGVIAGLVLALTSPISLVIGAIVLLATAWANNWGDIRGKTKAALDFVKKIIKIALDFVQKIWAKWGDEIMALVDLVWGTIQTLIKSALDIITFIIQAFTALIRGDWQAFGDAILGIWRTAWDTVKSIISNAKDTILSIISGIIEDIKDKFDIDWTGLGSKIVAGIKQGISDNWSAIIEWFKGKIEDFWDSITDFFGIDSPSKIAMSIGYNIQAGLAKGIEQGERLPVQAIAQTTRNVTQNFYQTINTQYPVTGMEFQQARALLST